MPSSSRRTRTTPISARAGRRRCSPGRAGRSATSSSPTARRGPTTRPSTPETLVAARDHEQREAARIFGVGSVVFLGYTDGELVYSRELLGAVTREIRAFQPFAVYTHDPEPVIINNSFVNHNDHRISGLAAVDAVYPTARDRLNFPEQIEGGLPTHKVRELYLWGANEPTVEVDISSVADTKIEGLMAHVSQFGGREDFVEMVRERWREEDGRYLERFPPRRPLPLTAR